MKVWYCFKKKRQLVKGEVDCDLAAAHKKCGWMVLYPVGSRVVSAEALVIEKDADGDVPQWADHAISGLLCGDATASMVFASLFAAQTYALARSKEGP